MGRREGVELRIAIARALRWAERTAALARETQACKCGLDSMQSALLASEQLAQRVEARRRALSGDQRARLRGSAGTPARGD